MSRPHPNLCRRPDWHAVHLREKILRLIARISSRVFLGEELCRNEEWLTVTREYTITAFAAAEELRLWPAPLRNFVHWLLPSCRRSREQVKEARRLFKPVLEKRRRQKLGGSVEFDDAIEWMEKESNGNYYDPVSAQLMLSLAAIHTTTDLICETLSRLVQHLGNNGAAARGNHHRSSGGRGGRRPRSTI